MEILVINLPQAKERWDFQCTQLKRLGLDFKQHVAFSGQDIDTSYYYKMYATGPRALSRNEVACFLSHRNAWQRCIDLGRPIIVLEDDSVLIDNFALIVNEFLSVVATKPYIVNLEMASPKKRLSKKIYTDQNGNYSLYKLAFAGSGAGCYLITPSAAKLCLAKSESKIGLADIFLFSVSGVDLLQAVPAMTMQLCFFGEAGKIGEAAETSINTNDSRRPTSLESFFANPMTRVRRLESWFITVWQRHILSVESADVTVVPHEGLFVSLTETKRLLKWLN